MKKVAVLTVLGLLVCQNAWAGETVIPEIPGGVFPYVLGGVAGAVLLIRNFLKK